jgi:hypothetical protein
MCELLFPKNDIACIRYFTALVKPRPNDQQQSQRQQTFLRALRTFPNISIHYGTFLSHVVPMQRAHRFPGQSAQIPVIKTEEKGSDVNLASYLLVDGFRGRYEVAVVISNDSDLATPIRLIRDELRLPVGVVNPRGQRSSWELRQVAKFHRKIRQGLLERSQLPDTLEDAKGTITKPVAW